MPDTSCFAKKSKAASVGRAWAPLGGRRAAAAVAVGSAREWSAMSAERARATLLRLATLSALLCLCHLPGGRPLELSDFAVPKSVVAGDSAELQCRYKLVAGEAEEQVILKWWWTPLNGSMELKKQLYQRIGSSPPQLNHINLTSKENDTIRLADLQPEDSGVFECEVAAGYLELRQHQKLLVYTQGSGPELNATVAAAGAGTDDGDVLVTCAARDVAPQPDLAITIDKNSQEVQQWVSAPESGRYNVTANVTVSKSVAVGAEIRCELFYVDESIAHPVFEDVIEFAVEGAATTTDQPLGTTEPVAAAVTEKGNAAEYLSSMPAIIGLSALTVFRYFC